MCQIEVRLFLHHKQTTGWFEQVLRPPSPNDLSLCPHPSTKAVYTSTWTKQTIGVKTPLLLAQLEDYLK